MVILSNFLAICFFQSQQGISNDVARRMAGQRFYSLEALSIDGKVISMAAYEHRVILLVNTASYCGFSPQYKGLENLYQKYKSRGFIVLAFPSNDFRGQEPGTNEEIKDFCSKQYNITFPLFSKVSVKGESMHPIYQWLLSHSDPTRDIEWNFHKFLISRSGQLLHRYSHKMAPESQELAGAIESALADQ